LLVVTVPAVVPPPLELLEELELELELWPRATADATSDAPARSSVTATHVPLLTVAAFYQVCRHSANETAAFRPPSRARRQFFV
jgi:hypothetical protein